MLLPYPKIIKFTVCYCVMHVTNIQKCDLSTSLRNPPFPLPPPPPKAKEEKKNSNENILIRTFFRGSNIKELLSYFFNVYLKANYYFIFTFSFISFLFNFYVCFLSLSSFYLYAHKNSVYSTFSV